MKDTQTYRNRLVVSANNRERGINQEQMPDTLLYLPKDAVMEFGRRAWEEPVKAGGSRESERTYYQGNTIQMPLNFEEMQPQHLALLAAYALGDVTSEANGGDGPTNGYHHTITPLASPLEDRRAVPTFTGVQRLGLTVEQRLAASLAVDSLSLSMQTDGFCRLTGTAKGTGKTQSNVVTELVAGTNGDADVTLSANAVEGADAAGRLDSVQAVFFKLDSGGGWQQVHFSAVSADTPAVITITAPSAGGSDAGTYKVIYVPDEDSSLLTGTATADPAWDPLNETATLTDSAAAMTPDEHAGRWLVMTDGAASGAIFQIASNTATVFSFEGYDLAGAGVLSGDAYKVVQFGWLPIGSIEKTSEPYLRINDVAVVVGGDYNGSSFSGGRAMGRYLGSLEWSWQGNLGMGFRAADGDYVGMIDPGMPAQTLTLDRRMREAVHRAMLSAGGGDFDDEAEYFSVQVTGTGPEIAGGYTYGFRITWPRLALTAVTPKADGEQLAETLTVSVKSHPTHGSVVIEIWNRVATYAAAA